MEKFGKLVLAGILVYLLFMLLRLLPVALTFLALWLSPG